MVDNFLKTCPACGFSFKSIDPNTGKYKKSCPKCGFKISEPNIFPPHPRDFDKKII